MVLRICSTFPSLRTPSNMLVMNLALSDFLLMVVLVPELCINYLSGGPWRFGELGCQIHAFTGKKRLLHKEKLIDESNLALIL